MTDPHRPEPEGQHDRTEGPDQEQVRRLLASAGAEASPTPPEVVARLDDVLAALVAQRGRSADHLGGPVLPTEVVPGGVTGGVSGRDESLALPEPSDRPARPAAAGHRRRWPQLLAAAAAVSVLALGATSLLGDGTVGEQAALDGDTAGQAGGPPGGPAGGQAESFSAQTLRAAPPSVSRATLEQDVQRIADLGLARPAPRADLEQCAAPRLGPGQEVVRVRFEGRRSVLVLDEASAGRRTARIFVCGTDRPAATTTVRVD